MKYAPTAMLFLSLGHAGMAAPSPDHAANMAKSLEIFSGGVRGVLVENCLKCHGGEKTRSEFDLATRDGLFKGGDQGVAVVAGKPDKSPLIDYLRHREEPHMPPKKPQLPEESIAAIETWIELGAAYDKPLVDKKDVAEKGPMQVSDEDRAYWAFAPLKRAFAGKTRIDDFVESGERASDEVLARRLHFDLIGLPPEYEDILFFLAPDSADNYGVLVDQLLASERFGERWARHWLDVARFAESHGFEHDYDRKYAYHFRDFVIRAFNDDMPYDQFVKWQLAGDEIAPDQPLAMMATGFLGAGVFPTQITISEAERVRYDAMDDMLATVGSAMLATTIGCARCHDHKYDPIPTHDYYRMLSAFTTTVRSDVDLDLSKLDPDRNVELDGKIAAAKKARDAYEAEGLVAAFRKWNKKRKSSPAASKPASWIVLQPSALVSKGGAEFVEQPDGSYLATGKNAKFDTYTFTASAPSGGLKAIQLEALKDDSMVRGGPGRAGNGNIALTDFKVVCGGRPLKLANPRATFEQKGLPVKATIDKDAKSAWAVDPQFGKDHAAMYEVANPGACRKGDALVFALKFENNGQHNIGRLRLSVSACDPASLGFGNEASPEELATQRIDKLIADANGAFDDKLRAELLELYKPLDAKWRALDGQVTELEAERRKSFEKVMVCSDGTKVKPMRHHTSSGVIKDFYGETYFLDRGDPRQKGEVASLGFLQVLHRGEPPREQGRTAMAEWITDPEHGAGHLLARVIVNRLWHHYFGTGIVATPNDFGFQGERPTHPELLDWLALQLIGNGWSLKHIHRLIVSSDAYKAKRTPRRLEGEAIRDNALAVSGLLDETMYGPGTLDEGMRRRSIYFRVKRSKLVPIMQLFDWPDTLTSHGRRAVTTTPSQALVFINDPNMRQMAEGFARRLGDVPDPVNPAYRIAYGRAPSEEEHAAAGNFLLRQTDSHGGDAQRGLADFCAALMSANEFIYIE